MTLEAGWVRGRSPFLALGIALAALALGGCAASTEDGPRAGDAVPEPAPAPPAGGDSGKTGAIATTVLAGQSIFTVKRPGSSIPAGARVVIDGPGIQVTATSPDTVWIQEAGDWGGCEIGNSVVAYRGIQVGFDGSAPLLARGQRIRVEGTVDDSDGHRHIVHAQVTPIGAPAKPYEAHCERRADELEADALDGVLVLTAGSTESEPAPSSTDGSWPIAPCFPRGGAPIEIGAELMSYDAWSPSWHWVRGVMIRRAAGARVEPRDGDDVMQVGDDACL